MTTLTVPGARRYREFDFYEVPGWMRKIDIDLFDRILAHQLDSSVKGDILEIGAYHGKSAIMLGYGLREKEQLTVCDLFDTDAAGAPTEGMDAYTGLTIDNFRRQYARFHNKEPVVHACPSSELRQLMEVRQFRFIHIDGGHAYSVVAQDIDLAGDVAGPDCVIVLDDYRAPHTPGVAAAFWTATMRHQIYPFLLSEGKAYAATTRSSQRWWLQSVQNFGFPGELHRFQGPPVLRVWCGDSCPDDACASCRSSASVS